VEPDDRKVGPLDPLDARRRGILGDAAISRNRKLTPSRYREGYYVPGRSRRRIMCGRYDLSENAAAIMARFHVLKVLDTNEFAPNQDVRPTDRAPIVRLAKGSGERELALARWGLVPSWAKDLKSGSSRINARAETVATQRAFRAAYSARRCLVPVSAFYEWSGPKGKRQRWRVSLRDEALFALAGLWEWWKDATTGDWIQTYTVITTDANEAIRPLHDRMPVILERSDEGRWLDTNGDATALLAPYARNAMLLEPR
jgi:putative SOS response-associated peptidase YedK